LKPCSKRKSSPGKVNKLTGRGRRRSLGGGKKTLKKSRANQVEENNFRDLKNTMLKVGLPGYYQRSNLSPRSLLLKKKGGKMRRSPGVGKSRICNILGVKSKNWKQSRSKVLGSKHELDTHRG